ncbi:MAG: hypothetical protein KatS3mg057_2882 [Herpetosiphonaceae bacterium]|nr:MAG: hypothetical protein KatS3mg057_2882 [Herpetosiphonaceae bacterium]
MRCIHGTTAAVICRRRPIRKSFQIGFPTLRPRAEIERMLTQEAAPLDPDGEKRLLDLSSLKMIDVELPGLGSAD